MFLLRGAQASDGEVARLGYRGVKECLRLTYPELKDTLDDKNDESIATCEKGTDQFPRPGEQSMNQHEIYSEGESPWCSRLGSS